MQLIGGLNCSLKNLKCSLRPYRNLRTQPRLIKQTFDFSWHTKQHFINLLKITQLHKAFSKQVYFIYIQNVSLLLLNRWSLVFQGNQYVRFKGLVLLRGPERWKGVGLICELFKSKMPQTHNTHKRRRSNQLHAWSQPKKKKNNYMHGIFSCHW